MLKPSNYILFLFLFIGPILYLLNMGNLKYHFSILAIISILYLISGRKVSVVFVIFTAFFLCASALTLFGTGDLGPFILILTFATSYIVLELTEMIRFEEFVSSLIEWYLKVAFFSCALGLVYAGMGGGPIITIQNFDGRDNYLFLSTLSNSWYPGFNFIRPSFVFDEPGTFAHFSLLLLAIRYELKRVNDIDVDLLSKRELYFIAAPLISFSLAYALSFVCIIFLIATRSAIDIKKVVYFFVLCFGLFCLFVFISSGYGDDSIVHVLTTRIVANGNFVLLDQDRVLFLKHGFERLDFYSFFWGINPSCLSENPAACGFAFSDLDVTILTPLVIFGILKVWPYYLIYFSLLVYSFLKFRVFIIALLLFGLQRPDLLNLNFISLTACLIYLICCSKKAASVVSVQNAVSILR